MCIVLLPGLVPFSAHIHSYGRTVMDFNRQSQMNNPEMVVKRRERHFEQQIANLEAATREMNILTEENYECGSDDEDENCSVPETCEYYDIVDAPYTKPPPPPQVTTVSGSGSGSGDTSDDRPTTDPCMVPITTASTQEPEEVTTTASPLITTPTQEPTTAIVNEITDGTTIGGPGGKVTTTDPFPIRVEGSAVGLTSSLLLVILITCCVTVFLL